MTLASIDAAIDNVSNARATFGSVQNRLEHTLNNLANYEENLTGVGEPIKDVDMASEMVNFTKLQILAAGRHGDARAGQPAPAVGALAPAPVVAARERIARVIRGPSMHRAWAAPGAIRGPVDLQFPGRAGDVEDE